MAKSYHTSVGEIRMTAFEKAWDFVKYSKLPHCPYCKGNLALARGEWDSKYCTSRSCQDKNPVKPYYKYPGNDDRWWGGR